MLSGFAGCDNTVTESDIQKWTNNEVGLRRIREVVIDAKQPLATRIRALEVMVEKGRGMEIRVRSMTDLILDDADRAQVLGGAVDSFIRAIEEKRPHLLAAKDAVMMSARYIAPEQFERARKAIAAWAFADLNWDLGSDDVKAKIQSRLSIGQIVDLGPYGYEAAAIIMSNAFNVEQMLRFLVDAKTPEASALAVKALRKLHQTRLVTGFELDGLSRMVAPAAANYLLELSRSDALEQELRDAAYSFALSIFRNKELPDAVDARDAAVTFIMESLKKASPNDRWYFARNIVELSAGSRLAEVLKTFPDDTSYASAEEDAAKSVMDFCFDLADLKDPTKFAPAIAASLKSGHRVQKAIAIICAKTAEMGSLIPALNTYAELVEKEEDVSLADLLGEDVTLGTLGRNALEGLALIAAARTALGEGKLTKEQFENKKFLIVVEYELSGDAYKTGIDERYNAWIESQSAKGAEAPTEAAKPVEAPPASAVVAPTVEAPSNP